MRRRKPSLKRFMFKPMQKRKSYCGTKHKLPKPKPRLLKLRDPESLQPIHLPELRLSETSFLQPHTSTTGCHKKTHNSETRGRRHRPRRGCCHCDRVGVWVCDGEKAKKGK